MKKINIIKKNIEFARIIDNNKPYRVDPFSFFVEFKNQSPYRFGISISKKVGKVTTRNKIKRQIKSILKQFKKQFKNNFDCIIIVNRNVTNLTFIQIQNQLTSLIEKIGLLEGRK